MTGQKGQSLIDQTSATENRKNSHHKTVAAPQGPVSRMSSCVSDQNQPHLNDTDNQTD